MDDEVKGMRETTHGLSGDEMTLEDLQCIRAEALFVSDVQRADEANVELVRAAVLRTVRRHGSRGCAALVAQEFGEHPETAPGRMTWALHAIRASYPPPSVAAAAAA
jgi:hypothetical protein